MAHWKEKCTKFITLTWKETYVTQDSQQAFVLKIKTCKSFLSKIGLIKLPVRSPSCWVQPIIVTCQAGTQSTSHSIAFQPNQSFKIQAVHQPFVHDVVGRSTSPLLKIHTQREQMQPGASIPIYTDGDKCATVNFFFGGGWKINLGRMKKFNIKSMNFMHKFNNLQFTVSEIWLWCF